MNINYRTAIQADAEQIAQLHADSWRRTYRGLLCDEFLEGDVVENRLAVWNDRLGKEGTGQFLFIVEQQSQRVYFVNS